MKPFDQGEVFGVKGRDDETVMCGGRSDQKIQIAYHTPQGVLAGFHFGETLPNQGIGFENGDSALNIAAVAVP